MSQRQTSRVESLQSDIIRLMRENQELRSEIVELRHGGGKCVGMTGETGDRNDRRGYRDPRQQSPRGSRRPREDDEYDDHERYRRRSRGPRDDFDRDHHGPGIY